jgi:asparagine synthase (glutamine-hydrolysing)
MVHDLRGMFAFAIWDSVRRMLFLARDPYGIKPLYYADDGWTFRFASQVKALLSGGGVSRDPDPAGHVGFYLWGGVPEPFTTCGAIRSLPAGSTLVVDRIGAHEPRRYHSIAEIYWEAEVLVRNQGARDGASLRKASSKPICRVSWTRWTSRRSTVSTPGSWPRRRANSD